MAVDPEDWRNRQSTKRMGAGGIRLGVGRLLCVEWQGPEPDRTQSLMFVYDGGVLTESGDISLPADELASFRFVDPEELDGLMVDRLTRRVRAAVSAQAAGTVVELEHGVLVRPRKSPAAARESGG